MLLLLSLLLFTFDWTIFMLAFNLLYVLCALSLSRMTCYRNAWEEKHTERRMNETGRRTFNHNNHTMLCIHVVRVFCLALSIWADSFAFLSSDYAFEFGNNYILFVSVDQKYVFITHTKLYTYAYAHAHPARERGRERENGRMDVWMRISKQMNKWTKNEINTLSYTLTHTLYIYHKNVERMFYVSRLESK